MAQKIELDDIFARQNEIIQMSLKLQTMNDGDQIVKESKVIQQKAQELEAMALVWEQQQKAALGVGPPPRPNIVKVELTDEQRKRVLDETGVRLEVVELEEGRDVMASMMPEEYPPVVEQKAIEKARALRAQAEAEAAAKAAANAAAEEIAKQNSPELNALLQEKMKDPNFLAGMLQKK